MEIKKIISDFRNLDEPLQMEILSVISDLNQIIQLYSPKTPVKYMARHEWIDNKPFDEGAYLNKLSQWKLITYERIGSTHEYLIKTSIDNLEKIQNILWEINEKDREIADQKYMKEEFEKKQINLPPMSKTFTGKNSKTLEKMLKLLKTNGEVENFRLVQCLKGKSKLTKKRFEESSPTKKLSRSVRNSIRTLRKHLKPLGKTIKYSQVSSRIESIK